MTIALPPDLEERVKTEAQRRGLGVNEYATQLIEEGLPRPADATIKLLRKWDEEDATDDPEEIARRQREGEEFMQNLARNRMEMEGPNAQQLLAHRMNIVLDSTPLALFLQRRGYRQRDECRLWIEKHLMAGDRFLVPEIVHYEVRRELLRMRKSGAVKRLESFIDADGIEFLPVNSIAMSLAAELWAQARQKGKPTADNHALDVDVILAAQVLTTGFRPGDFVVATSNIDHLSLFVPAELWSKI